MKPFKAKREVAVRYGLRLFVAGATARSNQAVQHVRQFCESHLKGRYDLEVIDIYQQPTKVLENQIVATPTLVKVNPKPSRTFIGSLAIVTGLADELMQNDSSKFQI